VPLIKNKKKLYLLNLNSCLKISNLYEMFDLSKFYIASLIINKVFIIN